MEANKVDQHIGSRVRQRRQSLRLSQVMLAACLDVPEGRVAAYEEARAVLVLVLSRTMKVPLAWFFQSYGERCHER